MEHLKKTKLMKLSSLFTLLIIGPLANAQVVTTCSDPEGFAYYHDSGIVGKKDAGWKKDKITDGHLTLKKLTDNKFDIQIFDANKRSFSLKEDGGEVIFMRAGDSDATFLHFYPGKAIEIYTFWQDSTGQFKYDLVQSKGGVSTPVHKSSVLVGTCSKINFDLLR